MLRCFNDCFATLFLWLALYCLQRRQWTVASLIYSIGLGTKMTLLLGLPALAVIFLQGRGFVGGLRAASIMAQVQLLLALPFLGKHAWAYATRAFDFSRAFEYKWTVNWRMLGEHVFQSKGLALGLLGVHAVLLTAFLTQRWLTPSQRSLSSLVKPVLRGRAPMTPNEELLASSRVTPEYVTTTLLTAIVCGLLCARSLHYQFYAYLAWTTPYLLWRGTHQPVLVYVLCAAQEWAWNVYPSTTASSSVVVGIMAMTVASVWWSTNGVPQKAPRVKNKRS